MVPILLEPLCISRSRAQGVDVTAFGPTGDYVAIAGRGLARVKTHPTRVGSKGESAVGFVRHPIAAHALVIKTRDVCESWTRRTEFELRDVELGGVSPAMHGAPFTNVEYVHDTLGAAARD